MINVAGFAIRRPIYPWLLIAACMLGGWYGIETVGRLEDPLFPIKIAYIVTSYPGASAAEVEQEVTEVLESAMQELPYLDFLTSKSVPGRSEIKVEMYEQYGEEDIPQIWDELRRRVAEAAQRFPPGVGTPYVEDDFRDVYGILYAVAAPGYSAAQIHDMSRQIATGLKSVPKVAKVITAGEPLEAIYVEVDHERLVRLGLPIDAVFASLGAENQVVDAGSVSFGNRRIRIAPDLAFDTVTAVGDMRIGRPGSTEILRLSDVATITRAPLEVPPHIIRHRGEPVFTVGVSIAPGQNVVDVGKTIDARMNEILEELPLGVTVRPIYRQHVVVEESISSFLRNLLLSVATVVGTLCLFMGWRAGTVVGSVLLLTVLGTLCLMSILGIELQRISLGALMIAMGMLVDNAIVIAEGMVIGFSTGNSAAEAAEKSVARTQYALLGATIIGILAFVPIGLSDDDPGQFLRSLFQVVAISLMLSWVLAITVVPLLGNYLLVRSKTAQAADVYGGWGYAPYRAVLRFGLRRAWLSAGIIVVITGACLWGFGFVKQGFFPSTNTPFVYVDLYLPQGTDIVATSAQVEAMEQLVSRTPGVTEVTSFIGRGATRFMATSRPELANPAYAQMAVRVDDVNTLNDLMVRLRELLESANADAEMLVSRSEFTPGGTSKIEARFSGPDADILRALGDQALAIYLAHDLIDRKTDWRQPELQIVPRFDETRARMAGVTRPDVARSLAFATLGVQVGLFRDADQLMPIIARAPSGERLDVGGLMDRLVWSPAEQKHIPMSQVVSRFELVAQDNIINRRDRARTIGVLANAPVGQNPTRVFNSLRAEIEAIELPPGYHFEWGGEHEASSDANALLISKIPATLGMMFLVTVLMFGSLRQPIVIWLTVPMIVCGVVVSLLITDMSFTFPAFLGFLSLSGMLIKNCVVLVDEIDRHMEESERTLAAVARASVSRLRPVMLASGTTIAGMAPLLTDVFFAEMAVCIMGGLAFATLLTLVAVPVFYRIALGKRLAAP